MIFGYNMKLINLLFFLLLGCNYDINTGSLISNYRCLSQTVIINTFSSYPDSTTSYIDCAFNLKADSSYEYSNNNIDWKKGNWNAKSNFIYINDNSSFKWTYLLYKDCIPPS